MTTERAAIAYLAEHMETWGGKGYAAYNPHGKIVDDLPVIYGFNNGGSAGWYHGTLIAEDGECLGGHICSHEGYMPHDLGVLDGSRADRHDLFRAHYPDGYRMDFVPATDVLEHPGLDAAFKLNQAKREQAESEVQS